MNNAGIPTFKEQLGLFNCTMDVRLCIDSTYTAHQITEKFILNIIIIILDPKPTLLEEFPSRPNVIS